MTYALRFRAYGQRRYLTLGPDITTHGLAQDALATVLAEVRLGIWRPPITDRAMEWASWATETAPIGQ